MASPKYGCLDPNPRTVEFPVAASQYFQHNGITLVNVDSSGNIEGCLTDTSVTLVLGMAVVPKGRGNSTNTSDLYWLSSATAGADKIPVILAESGYEFLMPASTTAATSHIGNAYDIVGVNTASTHYVDLAAGDEDVVIVTRLGTDVARGSATDVVVKMNPLMIQADT